MANTHQAGIKKDDHGGCSRDQQPQAASVAPDQLRAGVKGDGLGGGHDVETTSMLKNCKKNSATDGSSMIEILRRGAQSVTLGHDDDPHHPSLPEPEGVQFVLHTLPVKKDCIGDGDGFTAYVKKAAGVAVSGSYKKGDTNNRAPQQYRIRMSTCSCIRNNNRSRPRCMALPPPPVESPTVAAGTTTGAVWTLNAFGAYDATSAYRAQFDDLAPTTMNPLVWKNWAPPKCKTFAWLVLQDRVWTADRLQRRGWPNCGDCQLCKVQGESAAHMLFKCRYSVRIWRMIQSWLGLVGLDPDSWSAFVSVKEWWSSLCLPGGRRRRALSSLLLLVVWELWNERNARVFRGVSSMPSAVFAKIKHEASLWGLAGAKHLRTLMPRE